MRDWLPSRQALTAEIIAGLIAAGVIWAFLEGSDFATRFSPSAADISIVVLTFLLVVGIVHILMLRSRFDPSIVGEAKRAIEERDELKRRLTKSQDELSPAIDPSRHMFSKLMQVDVNGLWIEHAPYIDFIVHMRQTTDWTVTLEEVQGRTYIGGSETNLPPGLLNSPIRMIAGHNWYGCTIRQHLPQSMAQEMIFQPGELNLWGDDAEVTFSLGGLKWIGTVSTAQGDLALPDCVVLDKGFTILGPVREPDGDKVLWATNTVVVSQVWRQQSTGQLRDTPTAGES